MQMHLILFEYQCNDIYLAQAEACGYILTETFLQLYIL